MQQDLLPPNATDLEREVSTTLDRLDVLAPAVEELAGFKVEAPVLDLILPYLVAEYGLSDVSLYVDNLRQVISEGIVFQRQRGTLAAIHQALQWIGFDGTIEEQPPARVKWWWFQLHLPNEVRSSAFERPVVGVTAAAKPLRSELARVTAGYDKRGFRLNMHRLNGGALLNSWSGVRKRAGGPVLSLRYHHRVATDASVPIVGALEHNHGARVYLVDAGAATVTRSSLSVGQATTGASWNDNTPFQNAPFVDEAFGLPTPRVQKDY